MPLQIKGKKQNLHKNSSKSISNPNIKSTGRKSSRRNQINEEAIMKDTLNSTQRRKEALKQREQITTHKENTENPDSTPEGMKSSERHAVNKGEKEPKEWESVLNEKHSFVNMPMQINKSYHTHSQHSFSAHSNQRQKRLSQNYNSNHHNPNIQHDSKPCPKFSIKKVDRLFSPLQNDDDQQCTFHPMINNSSLVLANNRKQVRAMSAKRLDRNQVCVFF